MPNEKLPNKKSLHEIDGISQPDHVNQDSIRTIQNFRRKSLNIDLLIEKLLQGDIPSLSKAITIIESTNPTHKEQAHKIIQTCLPHANKSVRIGITGVPGVGKSTFIEAFGMYLTSIGKKVAVLAVDPSSTISKGSILGDKTRMEDLVKNANAFIRPSASGESLGGVSRKTRESIILCEACGFDTILIETVGVGQSETAVHSMTDFFLLLNLAGAGDELQGIKRGIMEMADSVIINKADGDNLKHANNAKLDINRALHLFPLKDSKWQPKVLLASAFYNQGIEDVWQLLEKYFSLTRENGYFETNRKNQNAYWLKETINEQLLSNFYQNQTIYEQLKNAENAVQNNEKSPFTAANELLELYNKIKKNT